MGLFDAQPLPSSPTSQQTTSGGIAGWAQPYVTNMLNQGQQLANQGSTDFQNQVFANAQNMGTPGQFAQGTGFLNQAGQGMLDTTGTALNYGQQGSQAGQAGMGYGQQGRDIGVAGGAQYGGQGAGYGQQGRDIGVAGGAQYGQQGAGYGQQASGAGQAYQQMATDPSQMAAYMNPYIQQSLAPQLALLNQQQLLGAQGINAKAAGQGAFGGNRATLAQGLNAQNYALAGQQAIGQGYNEAFKQAQQAQQFGSDLGLRGLQTGIQGAQTGLQGVNTQLAGTAQGMQGAQIGLQGVNTQLAGTAQGMQGAGLGIQGAQAGLQGVQGAQQGYAGATQAGVGLGNLGAQEGQYGLSKLGLQNQIANQQYNLPYQRAQFMQGLLQGLPIATQTQQGWQSPPNKMSQIGGLGSTIIGAAGLANKLGVLDNVKKLLPSGGGGGSDVNYGIPYGGDARDIGLPETPLSAMPYDQLPYDEIATGGYIRNGSVRRYASGGLVTLALAKALKG